MLLHENALEMVKFLCFYVEMINYKDAFDIYKETLLTAAKSENHEVVEVHSRDFSSCSSCYKFFM